MNHLMMAYWKNVADRGDKPKAVYAIISTGGQQPVGYCMGWSINKADARRKMDALPGNNKLVKVEPVL